MSEAERRSFTRAWRPAGGHELLQALPGLSADPACASIGVQPSSKPTGPIAWRAQAIEVEAVAVVG